MNKNVDLPPFWGIFGGICSYFFKKYPQNIRYKNVNGGMIPRGCSHGFIQYFPLIARVHTRANVNKMLTEKKGCQHEGQFEVCEEPMHRPDGTWKIGDLRSNASTPPRFCSFPIILYARIVVNAKLGTFSLCMPAARIENLTHKWYILPTINLAAAIEVLQRVQLPPKFCGKHGIIVLTCQCVAVSVYTNPSLLRLSGEIAG